MSKSKNYCFTLNNYTEDEFNELQELECRYIVIGKEIGDNGTPHLQGTICFANARAFNAIKKLIPKAHIEICKSLQDSIVYCKKDNNFVEVGDKPLSNQEKGIKQKERWIVALAEAKAFGETNDDEINFKYHRTIESIYKKAKRDRNLDDVESCAYWFWGETGTGKSRKAREDFPNAYFKMCNKWWDGYDDQDNVIIEDFDQAHTVLCHHVKIWGDRYPFLAEVKCDSFMIRPKVICITSNYHPRDIWSKDTDLKPILRRFKIVHFDGLPSFDPQGSAL